MRDRFELFRAMVEEDDDLKRAELRGEYVAALKIDTERARDEWLKARRTRWPRRKLEHRALALIVLGVALNAYSFGARSEWLAVAGVVAMVLGGYAYGDARASASAPQGRPVGEDRKGPSVEGSDA